MKRSEFLKSLCMAVPALCFMPRASRFNIRMAEDCIHEMPGYHECIRVAGGYIDVILHKTLGRAHAGDVHEYDSEWSVSEYNTGLNIVMFCPSRKSALAIAEKRMKGKEFLIVKKTLEDALHRYGRVNPEAV